MKDIWIENDSYSLAFLRLGNKTDYCTYDGGRVLSWQMAVKIVNIFPNGEMDELERFIDQAFDYWYNNDNLKFEFNVFLNYLKYLVSSVDKFGIIPDFLLRGGDPCEEFEYESERFSYTPAIYQPGSGEHLHYARAAGWHSVNPEGSSLQPLLH